MGCDCKKTYSIGMGCCQPVLAPADNYYTKYQTELKIEEAVSGLTGSTGCCITPEEVDEKISAATDGMATEQWVLDKHYITGVDLSDYALKSEIPTVPSSNTAFTNDAGYLTEHQPIKTINGQSLIGTGDIEIGTGGTIDLSNYYTTAQTVNLVESAVTRVEGEIPSLSGYATEQWVLDKHYISGVDLSDYVRYENLPDLSPYATKQWVINQNYATNAELIQYVLNLQNQIDSLRAEISGCCGDTGETLIRWITMTGENDYTCSGTTKMTKEKEQQSTDGGNTWTDTGNYRAGSTVLEVNSADCGYIPPIPTNYKYKLTLDDSTIISEECDSTSSITRADTVEYKSRIVSTELGDCITSIGNSSFYYETGLTSVIIPNSVEVIDDYAFNGCSGLTSCTIGSGVTSVGMATFEYCHGLTNVILPDSLTMIDCYAFYECSGLTSVVIGSGITQIDDYAFCNCRNLQSITINATTPPILSYSIHDTNSQAFDGTNGCPIYVPAQSLNAYKSATRWLKYSARIQAIP